MKNQNSGKSSKDESCPLVDIPCPQGEEAARHCQEKVATNFDPVVSFADYFILDCARELAEKHNREVD